MDTLSSTNTTAGMLDCASPESLLDPTARTPAGDQYGLGCVLYFCMTGRYPFPDGNAVEKMLAHQTQQPPPIRALNPTIPPALAGVVEQLMQKSPGARFRGMEELATALRPLAGAPAAVEDPTPPPGQAPEVLRRAFPPARELPPSLVETPRPTAPLRLSAVPARLPETLAPATPPRPPARPILPPPPPGARPSTLGRFLAALAFWQPAADPVVCTIFTPPSVQPGQTVQILVYAHPAEALLPVDTLARAALPGVEWLASGWTARPVPVGADLALHLGTGNGIGVTEPLRSVNWLSHPTGLRFELFVPWECPAGPVSCVLSLGLGGRLAGKVEFHLPVATAEPR
jgi:hypothetical protein